MCSEVEGEARRLVVEKQEAFKPRLLSGPCSACSIFLFRRAEQWKKGQLMQSVLPEQVAAGDGVLKQEMVDPRLQGGGEAGLGVWEEGYPERVTGHPAPCGFTAATLL